VIPAAATTVSERLAVSTLRVGLAASLTVNTTVAVPAVDTTPVTVPVAGSMLNPDGRPVADHEYGFVPPAALRTAV